MTFGAPIDEILFGRMQVSGATGLQEWDDDLATGIVSHFARFAEAELAPIDAVGLRQTLGAQSCEMVFQMVWPQISAKATAHPDPERRLRFAEKVARRGRVHLPGLAMAVNEALT